MTKLVTLCLVLATCGRDTPPKPAAKPLPGNLTAAALDAWVERELAGKVPSAVVGFVDANGLVWSKGFGERAPGAGRPDATTIYRIGSITKLVTGTALLQLRDRGTLTLDDPVTRWVPENPALSKVTLRHLVTHTSGISSIGDGSAVYWEQRPPDRAALVRAVAAAPAWEPGSKNAYSNAGMALAGEVIARAARTSYREYIQTAILAPLGMRTAVWDREAVPRERLALGAVGAKSDPPHWQLGAFEAAGGLYASLDDMTAFARFSLGANPSVLSDASRDAAMHDDPLPGPHGVAWLAGGEGRQRFAGHTGSTEDYSSAIFVAPEVHLGVIVLAAGSDADLVQCAAAALLRAAVQATPPDTCKVDTTSKPLDEPTRRTTSAALDRVLVVLADPTPAAITAAFEPAFLENIPAASLVEVVTQLRAQLGACTSYTLGDKGKGAVRGTFKCEKGEAKFEIAASAASRVAGIKFL